MAEEYQGEGTFDLQALSIQSAKSGGFNVVASKQGTGGNPGQSKRVDLQDVVDVSMIAPPYSEGTFAKGALVSREGKILAAKERITIGESTPFDPSKWEEVVTSNVFVGKPVAVTLQSTPFNELVDAYKSCRSIEISSNYGVKMILSPFYCEISDGDFEVVQFANIIQDSVSGSNQLFIVTVNKEEEWNLENKIIADKTYVDNIVGDVESLLAGL